MRSDFVWRSTVDSDAAWSVTKDVEAHFVGEFSGRARVFVT
jgi:hypothetical protein